MEDANRARRVSTFAQLDFSLAETGWFGLDFSEIEAVSTYEKISD
jgi:hypothetical protein